MAKTPKPSAKARAKPHAAKAKAPAKVIETAAKPEDEPEIAADEPEAESTVEATEADAEPEFVRDVAEDENETLVIPPDDDFAADHAVAVREPSDAEREAIAAHLELRVAELATYVRSEAAKFGVEPHGLAEIVFRQLREQLG